MTSIYIMRINWYNYNSSWSEGEAHYLFDMCRENARKYLEENYRASIKNCKIENAEMVYYESGNDNYYGISIAARYPGEEDRFLGSAEIIRVPLFEG